jgi:hypothetical protein
MHTHAQEVLLRFSGAEQAFYDTVLGSMRDAWARLREHMAAAAAAARQQQQQQQGCRPQRKDKGKRT